MPSMRQITHTLVSRLLVIIVLAICIIPGIFIMLLPMKWKADSRWYYYFMDFFYRAMLWATLLPIRVINAHNLPHDKPVIIAANHQSSLDIPLIGKLTRRFPHIWLAKKELLESPLLRFVIPRFTTLIDMSTPAKGMRSLVNALNMINDGKRRHAIIFPEGTRYTDGAIHDFYAGFVILAKKTGRSVVPIRIFNAHAAYPPETFWISRVPITLVVGEPMMIQPGESDEAFKDRVHAWFVQQREQ